MKSSWKLPYMSQKFFKNKYLNKKIINIRIRNSVIPYNFIKNNLKLSIFNGIWYLTVLVNSQMKGFKLGEFILTKKIETQTHLKKKVQKKTKGKK